jgi:hypothetical protein
LRQQVHPFLPRFLPYNTLHLGDQRFLLQARRELVGDEILPPDGAAETLPEFFFQTSERQIFSVARLIDMIKGIAAAEKGSGRPGAPHRYAPRCPYVHA